MKRISLSLAAIFLLTSCASPDPCSDRRIEDTLSPLTDLEAEYADADRSAAEAPPDLLEERIGIMEDLTAEAEDVSLPDCAQSAQTAFIAYAEANNTAITGFMNEEANEDMFVLILTAEELRQAYLAEKETLLPDES